MSIFGLKSIIVTWKYFSWFKRILASFRKNFHIILILFIWLICEKMENFQAKMSPTATELSYSGTPEGEVSVNGALPPPLILGRFCLNRKVRNSKKRQYISVAPTIFWTFRCLWYSLKEWQTGEKFFDRITICVPPRRKLWVLIQTRFLVYNNSNSILNSDAEIWYLKF